MNNQQTAPNQQITPKVQRTGRPLWQVSLKASLQRGRKKLKARLYANALQHCPACQTLSRAA
jgi:hypothetical protein